MSLTEKQIEGLKLTVGHSSKLQKLVNSLNLPNVPPMNPIVSQNTPSTSNMSLNSDNGLQVRESLAVNEGEPIPGPSSKKSKVLIIYTVIILFQY